MYNAFYQDKRLLALSILVILVAGFSSFFVLPRLEDPILTPRFANVTTIFPGARADRVEVLVTEPLEEELQEIEEIKKVRSTSRAGVSALVIELRDDVYEVDTVWSRIRDKIDDAAVNFPPGVLDPDIENIDTEAFASIVALSWVQDDQPSYAILLRLAEELEDRIRAISGTEDVETFGMPTEEITVEIRPADLASIGLTAADVAQQLEASDAKMTAGQLQSDKSDMLIEIDGELDSLERIGSTPIQFGQSGQFVPLSSIAEIRKGIRDPAASLAMVDDAPAVMLGFLVRGTYRLDLWNVQAQQALEDFSADLPKGIALKQVFEQSPYVETRLSNLLWNLLIGGSAVIAVVLLIMGWRSAIVVGAALPLSALMVLAGMRWLEIPMHQMSVTGLIIALGLLIDNAIVVVDEVKSRIDEGQPPANAVAKSTKHLMIPLLGSTLTTVLAFAPIALMPGPAGEFVGSIALSVMLAICSSFLLAMTVTPAMAAISNRMPTGEHSPFWETGIRDKTLSKVWRRVLGFLFRRPVVAVLIAMFLPVLGFIQASQLPEQFFPPADRNQFQIELELPPFASLSNTKQTAKKVSQIVRAHPEVEGIDWVLGESAPTFYYNIVKRRENNAPYGQAIVQLKSAEGAAAIINQLQRELDRSVPEARILARQLEQGPPFDAPIEILLYGPDLNRLRELGREIRAELASIPAVTHTRSDLEDDWPKLGLKLDEEEVRLAGLSQAEVARQIAAATVGNLGGSVLEGTEELPVRVRVADHQRSNLDDIRSLDLLPAQANNPSKMVPLSAVGQIRIQPEMSAITRLNNLRMNEVKAYIEAGVLPSTVLAKLEQQLDAVGFEMPPGYKMTYGGEADGRDQAVGNLMSSVGVLMVLMVATLVLSFRSFRAAALIGGVGVLSIGLGMLSLWIFGFPFGFMAIVGTMGLIGVAINDSIVVLAALREDELAKLGDRDAVLEVVVHATRHVVATTVTTVVGFMPLVISGGGFWPPLAVSIAGGVTGATLLALCFVPTFHLLITNPLGKPVVAKHSEKIADSDKKVAPQQARPTAYEPVQAGA